MLLSHKDRHIALRRRHPTASRSHGRPMRRHSTPHLWASGASPLNVDKALIGQLSPLGKLSPAIESSRACPSYRVSEGGRGHGRVADERQMLTQDGRSTVSARLSTLSTLSFMNQCQRQRLSSELMVVRM